MVNISDRIDKSIVPVASLDRRMNSLIHIELNIIPGNTKKLVASREIKGTQFSRLGRNPC
jgi:hypothetical protein